MTLGRRLHGLFFKRTSVYALAIIVGAVFFERAFDQGMESIWERKNQGVSISIRSTPISDYALRITRNTLT